MRDKARKSGPKRRGGSVPFLLHVLVYRDADEWLAHCLEFDTVAQAESPEAARRGLENALGALISDAVEHDDIRGLFRPAPSNLWSKYAEAERKGRLRKSIRSDLSLDDRLVPA